MATKPKETTTIDFAEMSMEELQSLVNEATVALERKKDVRRQELLAELEALGGAPEPAKRVRASLSVDAIGTRAKPPVKFRDDKGNTWTGRGATPKWLAAYEAEGRQRSEFAV